MAGNHEEVLKKNADNLTKEQYEQIVKDGTGYEPSVPVKRSYLPLRKKDRLWGGVKYPGLFDYDPGSDAGWFWFTVSLEVISLGFTYFLLEEMGQSAEVLLISALSIFCLDFTFAYFHHRSKGIKCLIENQKRLFLAAMRPGIMDGPFANYTAHLDRKLKDNVDCKLIQPISALLIWILSFIKGGVFFLAIFQSYWFQSAVGDSKAPYLLIIVIVASYLWIAYNHLMFTGYFLAGVIHKKQVNEESAEYFRQVGGNLASMKKDSRKKTSILKNLWMQFPGITQTHIYFILLSDQNKI